MIPKRKRVLVVEDERDLADLLVYNLGRAGYDALAAHDGRTALDAISRQPPDLILLDVMLPELSGTEVAGRLRNGASTASIPIIMLTAKADEVDQIVGLAIGADDYITKPFSMKVLLARVEALLRRAGDPPSTAGAARLGPIEVNLETHRVTCEGQQVRLTLTEFRLLAFLVQAGGRVLTRHSLMTKAMGPGITVTDRTVDVHITSIRKKLGALGGVIRTVRGVGYSATLEPETSDA